MLSPQRASRDSPLSLFPVTGFGGLNLVDDPQEVGFSGAIDLLNVDLDHPGRVRSRNGYSAFRSSAAWKRLFFYDRTGSNPQLLALEGTTLHAINSVGGDVATQTSVSGLQPVRWGNPSSEYVYFADGIHAVRRYDGATFTSPAGMPTANYLAVSPASNRLVAAVGASKVQFSDPGAPETWSVNNYVDVTPGDGERIAGMVSYGPFLFVFKQTKFFVFYGESVDSTGAVEFNYRPVTGTGATYSSHAVVAGPDAVYFFDGRRVWSTTGGQARPVSRPIDPYLRNDAPSYFGTPGFIDSWGIDSYLSFAEHRLYLTVNNSVSGFNTFVYDTEGGYWLFWDVAVFSVSEDHFLFGAGLMLANGADTIGRMSHFESSDAGTAITSRYRTGFSDLGIPESEKLLREVLVDTTGTVTVKVAVNDGTLDTGKVAAGGRVRRGYRGRNFSVELSGTGAWEASRLACATWDQRPAQERSQ